MYADDTSISFTARSVNDLNMKLDSLRKWFQGNNLTWNVLKTQAMVIGSRPNLKKISTRLMELPPFSIGGSKVEMVDSIKYLGVQIYRTYPVTLGMNISSLYDLRSLVQSDSLNMARCYLQWTLSVKCIVVSLNHTSATAVRSGGGGHVVD